MSSPRLFVQQTARRVCSSLVAEVQPGRTLTASDLDRAAPAQKELNGGRPFTVYVSEEL